MKKYILQKTWPIAIVAISIVLAIVVLSDKITILDKSEEQFGELVSEHTIKPSEIAVVDATGFCANNWEVYPQGTEFEVDSNGMVVYFTSKPGTYYLYCSKSEINYFKIVVEGDTPVVPVDPDEPVEPDTTDISKDIKRWLASVPDYMQRAVDQAAVSSNFEAIGSRISSGGFSEVQPALEKLAEMNRTSLGRNASHWRLTFFASFQSRLGKLKLKTLKQHGVILLQVAEVLK